VDEDGRKILEKPIVVWPGVDSPQVGTGAVIRKARVEIMGNLLAVKALVKDKLDASKRSSDCVDRDATTVAKESMPLFPEVSNAPSKPPGETTTVANSHFEAALPPHHGRCYHGHRPHSRVDHVKSKMLLEEESSVDDFLDVTHEEERSWSLSSKPAIAGKTRSDDDVGCVEETSRRTHSVAAYDLGSFEVDDC
jgi:hypothetical protein